MPNIHQKVKPDILFQSFASSGAKHNSYGTTKHFKLQSPWVPKRTMDPSLKGLVSQGHASHVVISQMLVCWVLGFE